MDGPWGPGGRVHEYHHTVRYFECDQQGVVFNMWYLGYFDEALSSYLGGGGLDYQELIRAGVDVQLVHSEIDWVGPLRWGDEAVVAVRLVRTGTTSFTLAFVVSAAAARTAGSPASAPAAPSRPVATGRTAYVTIRTDGSGKVAIPPRLAAALGTGAAG